MVSVCFRSDSLSVQGNVSWHESMADSGNRMQRGFCAYLRNASVQQGRIPASPDLHSRWSA